VLIALRGCCCVITLCINPDYVVYIACSGGSSRWNSHWRWQLFIAFPKPLEALISGLDPLWLLAPTVFTVVFVERVEARSSVIDWGVVELVEVSVSLVPGSAEVNMKVICRRNR
jgi:hypothetical protein